MYTNNQPSPLFDTTGTVQFRQKIINFDVNRPVKSVQARSGSNCASKVYFLDKDGQEIDFFNPGNFEREGIIHGIGDNNEELIGVYGVRNKPG